MVSLTWISVQHSFGLGTKKSLRTVWFFPGPVMRVRLGVSCININVEWPNQVKDHKDTTYLLIAIYSTWLEFLWLEWVLVTRDSLRLMNGQIKSEIIKIIAWPWLVYILYHWPWARTCSIHFLWKNMSNISNFHSRHYYYYAFSFSFFFFVVFSFFGNPKWISNCTYCQSLATGWGADLRKVVVLYCTNNVIW